MNDELSLADALGLTDEARIVTKATPPYKIVHTNKAWSEATGFKFTEVCGQTCGFLQGAATKGPALAKLHSHLMEGRPSTATLINYDAEGKPFHNRISIAATICGTHFVGTIKATPITDGSVAAIERPPMVAKRQGAVNFAKPENYENATKRPRRSHEHVRLADGASPSARARALARFARAPSRGLLTPARAPQARAPHLAPSAVLANTTDPIVLCAKEYPHQITHPNGPWLEMCGYELEEVEGVTNRILTGPETSPEAITDLLKCVRKLEPSTQARAAGRLFPPRLRKRLLVDHLVLRARRWLHRIINNG